MKDIERYIEELEKSSLIAEKALEVSFSVDFSIYPEEERHTWAAAALIHCDIFRYFVAYETSTSKGVVRLLWIGDIVCTLYEARKWFFQSGNRSLISIAASNGYGEQLVREKLKQLKDSFPLNGIDAYEKYRNKAGHHYDSGLTKHVHTFSQMEYDPFHKVFVAYSRFANEWLKLCLEVIKRGHPPKA